MHQFMTYFSIATVVFIVIELIFNLVLFIMMNGAGPGALGGYLFLIPAWIVAFVWLSIYVVCALINTFVKS